MRQTLNFKIYQDLYNKIRSHFYKPGEQLPTESALAERYSTSLSHTPGARKTGKRTAYCTHAGQRHFCFQFFTMGKHAFNERFWRTFYRQKSR